MFEASVDGQPYDTERWGQYYRPAGVQAPAGGSSAPAHVDEESAPAPAAKPAPVVSAFDDDEPAAATAPVQATAPVAGANKAEDILAMIRARQQK